MSTPDEIPDKNLFMMCRSLNARALTDVPSGFRVRSCRRDELDVWMAMPFDGPEQATEYRPFMRAFFDRVYAKQAERFFERCQFVVDERDRPLATAFVWKIYDEITTFHWLKTLPELEGRGLGRAIVSHVMKPLAANDYPVFLHTQPGSYRAVKLYSDFGFELLSDPVIGRRTNDLQECLPILRAHMPESAYRKLRVAEAPARFLACLAQETEPHF